MLPDAATLYIMRSEIIDAHGGAYEWVITLFGVIRLQIIVHILLLYALQQ